MRVATVMCAVLLGLCAPLDGARAEVDSTEILIKALIRKGVITQQDADELRAEIEEARRKDESARKAYTVTGKRPIKVGGYIQERFVQSAKPGAPDSLEVRRLRMIVAGDATDKLEFKAQWELAGSRNVVSSVNFESSTVSTTRVSRPQLLDAYLGYKLGGQNKLTLGQFFIPFSLESLTSNTALDMINRPLVVESLVPGRDTSDTGRDIGVQYAGTGYPGGQTTQQLDYFAGLFNGAGTNVPENNGNKDPALRLVYRSVPIGVQLGASYYRGTVGSARAKRCRRGLEAALDRGAWALKSEYIWANDTARNSNGWYATLLRRFNSRFEGALRIDRYDPNEGVDGDAITTTTAGLNWNLAEGGYSRIQFNYEYVREQVTQLPNNRFMGQFQAGF